MLMDASPADLDFLGLGRIDPPMLRHDDPEAEDTFCQRLLLLGAKWWDSMERGLILSSSEELYVGLDESDEPEPTERERSWISIAWPTGGGLVVSEFDTTMWGVQNTHLDAFVPDDPARLRLCTSMDEKAQVLLNRFRGTVWEGVEHYRGNVFIGCWGTKITGEVGQFQKTWPET
jgi:hypothetical protein